MIKAVVLDVDGVIVGRTEGVNFPLPHREVIQRLKIARETGIPIILCTAKFGFAIRQIVDQAALNNPHVADGGALIMGPTGKNSIIKTYKIEKKAILDSINLFLEQNLYLELYTPSAHYVQQSQVSEFTHKRTKLLQLPPTIVATLSEIPHMEPIIKMITFTKNDNMLHEVEHIVRQVGKNVTLFWSRHPYLGPMAIGIMTAPEVSKAKAVTDIITDLGIPFQDVLAIGDTKSDWEFMKLCGYVATLENGDNEIKRLVKTKGSKKYFISSSVEENGFISILDHFQI